MDNSKDTVRFGAITAADELNYKVLRNVYESLTEKGYDPISQIVGYILSDDPTYITDHNNARSMISRVDRDELLACMVKSYLGI